MSLVRSEVQLLFWKEIQQLTRNQGSMVSSFFTPAVLVVLAPVLALLAGRTPAYRAIRVPDLTARLPGFDLVHDGETYFLYVTLPALFVLAALLAPLLAAAHALITERERHSLELLLALPVLVPDILTAKLAATLATALATILPMFLVDVVVLLSLTEAGAAYVLGALFLMLATLVAAAGAGLLIALLARDLRTATALAGMLAAPPLLVTALCIVFVPAVGKFEVLGLLMLAMGCGAIYAGTRWLTLERYVS